MKLLKISLKLVASVRDPRITFRLVHSDRFEKGPLHDQILSQLIPYSSNDRDVNATISCTTLTLTKISNVDFPEFGPPAFSFSYEFCNDGSFDSQSRYPEPDWTPNQADFEGLGEFSFEQAVKLTRRGIINLIYYSLKNDLVFKMSY